MVDNKRFEFYNRNPRRCGQNAKYEVNVKASISRDFIRTSISNDDQLNAFIALNPVISRDSASLSYLSGTCHFDATFALEAVEYTVSP
jgi:hypothetical protein